MAENPQNQAESGHFGCMAVSFCTCLLDCFLFWWYGGIVASKKCQNSSQCEFNLSSWWLKLAQLVRLFFVFDMGALQHLKKVNLILVALKVNQIWWLKLAPALDSLTEFSRHHFSLILNAVAWFQIHSIYCLYSFHFICQYFQHRICLKSTAKKLKS